MTFKATGLLHAIRTLTRVRKGLDYLVRKSIQGRTPAFKEDAKDIVMQVVYAVPEGSQYKRTMAILNAVRAKSRVREGEPGVEIFIAYIPSDWEKPDVWFSKKSKKRGTQAKSPGGRDDTYASFFLPKKSADSFLNKISGMTVERDFFSVWEKQLGQKAKWILVSDFRDMIRGAQ